jgi:hypothetical protein
MSAAAGFGLAAEDEKRLESVAWLQGARFRGVQVDLQTRDVSLFALTELLLVELLCEDAVYLGAPDLFNLREMPRIVGLVVQPLEELCAVRLEFSNHPAQVLLQCRRVVVRKDPL